MSNQKRHDQDASTPIDGIRKHFLPGGKLAPINDLAEYERQMNALPPSERELAQEVTICANMCQFFSEKNWTVPHQIRVSMLDVKNLEIPEPIGRMREINQELMEIIHSASPDT